MKIAILKEKARDEARVAASPETVKKYIKWGADVAVEKGAGAGAALPDAAFKDAGATIAATADSVLKDADIVLCVQAPEAALLEKMKRNTLLIGFLDPYNATLTDFAKAGLRAMAIELVPRISRAQSMDALSSQSNLAGYRAVIDAAATFGKAMPLMMTAAGTVTPAKVLILGAGVAGLQAIATAKRLGAVVSAFDVRPAVKEQVQSLGASFVEVEADDDAETSGGYAKEMSDDYKKRQQAELERIIPEQDIIITTALIPGRPAPELISEKLVKSMKMGAVIIDMAAPAGGNCALTQPGKVVDKHGVTIVGHTNLASRMAVDTSKLYARNLMHLLDLIIDKESSAITLDREDDIIKGCLLTDEGAVVHAQFKDKDRGCPR